MRARRRLSLILTHLSSPALPPAASTSRAHYRLHTFHTRATRSRIKALTDAHLAISRLPASPPLSPSQPVSPAFSTYSSVWSSIVSPCTPSSTPIIPPQSDSDAGKLTVVLDMDECLLHSTFDNTLSSSSSPSVPPGDLTASPPPTALHPPYSHPIAGFYNITFTIGDSGEGEERVFVSFRPHLLPFLHSLHRRFEVILFTSALPIYAAPVLAYLSKAVQSMGGNTSQPLFRHQLYRASTVPLASFQYVKDIRRLGRDMRRILIVDNNPLAMIATPDNAILVPDWNGGEREQPEVLREVLMFVERVEEMRTSRRGEVTKHGEEGDVRPLLRQSLGFRRQLEAAGIDFAANNITAE